MSGVAIETQKLLGAATPGRPYRRGQPAVFSFPPFRLDMADERLWKNGRELHVRPKPFAILCYLAQHPRRLVTQSEIVDAVWEKRAMSESLLRTHVRDLRSVLGEDVIETVVGRGYRFLSDVSEIDDAGNENRLAGRPALELVRTFGGRSPGESSEIGQAPCAADNARVLTELTEALTTLGMGATVLLVVGHEHRDRISALFGAASGWIVSSSRSSAR